MHRDRFKIGAEFRQQPVILEIYMIDRLNKLSIHKMFVSEYNTCDEIECTICLPVWNHPECLPSIFKYILYSIVILITLTFIIYLKLVIEVFIWIFRSGRMIWSCIKAFVRLLMR